MECSLRNNYLITLVLLVVCFGCQQKTEQNKVKEDAKPELIMYQPSEMATFMNAMYAYNLQLRQQIIDGDVPTTLPLDLMQLHSAEMSNGHERSAVWNSEVNGFIETQQAVVDTLSNEALKTRYNAAINNCLACHKTECTGPIPKIKRLIIQ